MPVNLRERSGCSTRATVLTCAAMRGIQYCRAFLFIFVAAGAFAIACGGSTTPAEVPDEDTDREKRWDSVEANNETTGEQGPQSESGESTSASEPEFTDGMSVNEAINAVPQGTERVNIEEEELSRPLLDGKLYEPCKPKPNQHFTVRVAIWDGRAVGIDVTPQPKNDALAACVKEQVRTVTWRGAVKSLNTVEYNY
jgi:hypothetical protein